MKLVTLIGIEKGDFTYYLSMMLKNLRTSVLVIDNSNNGDLFYSLTRKKPSAKKERVLEFENIAFVRGINYNLETFEKFEYVICFNGWSSCDEIVANSDYIYIMPDYHLDSLDKVKTIFQELEEILEENEEDKVSIIMRDLVSEKITDMAVTNYIGILPGKIVGHITMDPADAAKQISFEYQGIQNVKGLSTDFLDALCYVAIQVTEKSDKVIKKLLKKA